jgi:hypothetical protein
VENEVDEFYRWLGMCVAEWANVDNRLLFTCWTCMRTHIVIAGVAYYHTRSLWRQLELTNGLLHASLVGETADADLKEWDAIKSKIEKLLPVRNRLAHQPVGKSQDFPWSQIEPSIDAAFAETLLPRYKMAPSLRLADLKRHLTNVRAVVASLDAFHVERLQKHG